MSLETGNFCDQVLEIEIKIDVLWSEKSEIFFVKLMEAEVLKGNRATITFTKNSWNYVEEQMKLYTGHVYTHQQIKHKLSGLRQTYKRFKKLVDHRTCSFCEELKSKTGLIPSRYLSIFKNKFAYFCSL